MLVDERDLAIAGGDRDQRADAIDDLVKRHVVVHKGLFDSSPAEDRPFIADGPSYLRIGCLFVARHCRLGPPDFPCESRDRKSRPIPSTSTRSLTALFTRRGRIC